MIKIFNIIVKPNSSENKIIENIGNNLKISIKSPAEKGKANKELINLLSKHFKKKVEIKKGLNSRKKLIKVHL